MKKILLFTIGVLFALTSLSQSKEGVLWEKGTLQEALHKVKQNKKGAKFVFLDCYTTWCGPCKNMANVIFPTKEAGEYFNKNFVNIKIDMEKGEGVELGKKYSVSAYPTFLILDETGKEIGRIVGGDELYGFIKKVERAKDFRNSLSYMKSLYDIDKTVDNAVNYLKVLEEAHMREEMTGFLSKSLLTFQAQDIFSSQLWSYFSNSLSADRNRDLLKYLLDHKTIANTCLGKEVVDKSIVGAYSSTLLFYMMGAGNFSKEEIKDIANTIILLATQEDRVSVLYATVAILYVNEDIEAIKKLYQFSNHSSYSVAEMQKAEYIFNSIKQLTKEQRTQYYKDKADFFAKQMAAAQII